MFQFQFVRASQQCFWTGEISLPFGARLSGEVLMHQPYRIQKCLYIADSMAICNAEEELLLKPNLLMSWLCWEFSTAFFYPAQRKSFCLWVAAWFHTLSRRCRGMVRRFTSEATSLRIEATVWPLLVVNLVWLFFFLVSCPADQMYTMYTVDRYPGLLKGVPHRMGAKGNRWRSKMCHSCRSDVRDVHLVSTLRISQITVLGPTLGLRSWYFAVVTLFQGELSPPVLLHRLPKLPL